MKNQKIRHYRKNLLSQNQISPLEKGLLVKHREKDEQQRNPPGLLINQSKIHPDYWDVLFMGNLSEWHIFNIIEHD